MHDNTLSKKVCIILVNYNTTEDTIECVKSLNKIDYSNYSIIVVDNASSEDISELELLEAEKKIVLIQEKDNLGFAGGNNKGIKYAMDYENVDYMLLLNNDTVVKSDFLSILVNEAEADREAGIICGTILRFASPNEIWYKGGETILDKGIVSHWGYGKDNDEFSVEKQYVSFATGCLWLLPRSTIEKTGLLTEDYFLYAEDTDYCCRVLQNGLKILFVPEAIIWHKVGRSSKVSRLMQYYMVRNDFLMFSRLVLDGERKLTEIRLLIQKVKDVLRGRIALSALISGYEDYKRGITGRKG